MVSFVVKAKAAVTSKINRVYLIGSGNMWENLNQGFCLISKVENYLLKNHIVV